MEVGEAMGDEGWWDGRSVGRSDVSPLWYDPRQQVHERWTAIVSL